MLTLLGVLAFLVAFTIVPVMIGARVVGARNTGFGSALLAVLALAAISKAAEEYVADDVLAAALTVIASSLALAGILGTTFFRGVGLGLVMLVVQIAAMILLAILFPELTDPFIDRVRPEFSP